MRVNSGRGHHEPARRTTWTAAALFAGALAAGGVGIAIILSIATSDVGWTGGWPVMVFASAIATWAVLLMAGVQVWDLMQIERHGPGFQIVRGNERLLPGWLQTWLPLAVPVAGFLIGWKLW